MSERKYTITADEAYTLHSIASYPEEWTASEADAWLAVHEYRERTCRFKLELDRDVQAERAKAQSGEWTPCDFPLAWTCSACGKQYAPVTPFPAWLKHCPECGAKVVKR